jgi:hypothetical protein
LSDLGQLTSDPRCWEVVTAKTPKPLWVTTLALAIIGGGFFLVLYVVTHSVGGMIVGAILVLGIIAAIAGVAHLIVGVDIVEAMNRAGNWLIIAALAVVFLGAAMAHMFTVQ